MPGSSKGGIIVLKDHQPAGPFTRAQVHEALGRGDFTLRHLAHLPGMKEWRPLGEILHELDEAKGPVVRSLPPVPSLVPPPAQPPELSAAPARPPQIQTPPEIGPALSLRPPMIQTPPEIGPPRLVHPPGLPEPKAPPMREGSMAGPGVMAPPPLPGPSGAPSSTLPPAPFLRRFRAWLLDCAILFVPILALFGLLYLGIGIRSLLEHWDAETYRQERLLLWRNLGDLMLLVALGFSWIYAAGLESSRWQGTVGKQWMGLTVVDESGARLHFLQATKRHFAKYLSALPVFLGFIAAGFDAQGRAWHDRLAGTRVTEPRSKP